MGIALSSVHWNFTLPTIIYKDVEAASPVAQAVTCIVKNRRPPA
jgi:hypothetical protein